MHRLTILTADPTPQEAAASLVVTYDDGRSMRYHLLGRIGDLLYYRNASMTDEEARTLAGFDLPDVPAGLKPRG